MKPEAESDPAAARDDLREAGMIAALPLPKAAARSAYYGVFHAAEALIFERTGEVAKTHSGVRSAFSRLLLGAAETDVALSRTLMTGCGDKEVADYGIGPRRIVTERDAAEMIEAAARFVARIAEPMAAPPFPGPA